MACPHWPRFIRGVSIIRRFSSPKVHWSEGSLVWNSLLPIYLQSVLPFSWIPVRY